MTPALTVTPAPPDEEEGLALLAAFVAEVAALYPGFDPSLAPSADPAEISPPAGAFLVLREDGRPVGCGALKRLDAQTAEVKRLYVAPQARGRGGARLLLAALEDRARQLGCSRTRLDTGARQPGALRLFQSDGYTAIADYNGNPFAAHWLEKELGSG
jgi:GNAT superfamily N-acetyltransferase